ncbi:MAG: biotin transporter BioY [Spirochaetales bacterium]|uniref:Biotin transporter n=1 Tax=Candidatus Thalassospirochaeta sargassi TaxID=3119039 RepID=A0AAJ1IHH2_9SPIO|nr:biotin transporter BioY [Spirochaetales bacterium]
MNSRDRIKRSLIMALFSSLMIAGAFIRIPVGPVPVTLTSFFMLTAGLLLGPVGGSLSVLIYLIIGLMGFPAFAGGSGPAVFAGPTGGFLIAYLVAVFICGIISAGSTQTAYRRLPVRDIAAVITGSIVLYAIGVPWLKWRLGMQWPAAFSAGMLPFLPGDAVKAVAAVIIRQVLNRTAPELLPERE